MPDILGPRATKLFYQVQRFIFSKLIYLLIFYLFTFLVLAVIRIITGVSIKRIGYFSLRDVSFSPKPGVSISMGAIGLKFHRPTVTRPGWCMLYINGLDITLDPKAMLHPDAQKKQHPTKDSTKSEDHEFVMSLVPPRTRMFYVVRYILRTAKCLEIMCINTSFSYKGVFSLLLGTFQFRLDLRDSQNSPKFSGTLDSYVTKDGEIPAHAKFLITDVYMGTELVSNEHEQVLENISLDVDGILGEEDLSLKELATALRLGKATVRVDHVLMVLNVIKELRHRAMVELCQDGIEVDGGPIKPDAETGPTRLHAGFFTDGDRNNLAKFGTLFIRIVKQIDFKTESLSIFGIPASREDFLSSINDRNSNCRYTSFAVGIEAIAIDMRRLNPENPGFKLNFKENDCAHQGIMTFTSLSFGMDIEGVLDEIGFIPLITIITKANVFAQTLQMVQDQDRKNESVVRAGVYIVMPNLNLDAKNLPVLTKALQDLCGSGSKSAHHKKDPNGSATNTDDQQPTPDSPSADRIFVKERLWPRAVIRLNIEEPAARIILPVVDGYSGMVISAASKVCCDIDATHTVKGDQYNYEMELDLQTNAFETWYRSGAGTRHDIFLSEAILFKAKASTQPQLSVAINTKITNAHFLLTKDEVLNNLRQVFVHFQKAKQLRAGHTNKLPKDREEKESDDPTPSPIRKIPTWLSKCKVEIFDITASIATENARAKDSMLRGVAMKVARSVLDYRADVNKIGSNNQNGLKAVAFAEHRGTKKEQTAPQPKKSQYVSDTDGRRIAMAFEGVEAYRVEEPYGLKKNKDYEFVNIPGLSLSCTSITSSGKPSLQLNVLMKKAVLAFDANIFFLLLLITDIMKTALAVDLVPTKEKVEKHHRTTDFIALQVKTEMIRVKLYLPNSTDVMLETNALTLSKRYGMLPQVRADNIRLYSGHPTVIKSWAIIATLKGLMAELNDKKELESRITLNFDAMRLNAPYQFLFHRVFDNIINLAKCCINLHKQYKLRKWDLVIGPQEVKQYPRFPKIRVKSKSFIVTLEDDHFESDLGLIFRTGTLLQKERLEKERIFERKASAISSAKKTPAATTPLGTQGPGLSAGSGRHAKKQSEDKNCAITSSISHSLNTINAVSREGVRDGAREGVNDTNNTLRKAGNSLRNAPSISSFRSETDGNKKKNKSGFKEVVHHALHPHPGAGVKMPQHHDSSGYSINSKYIPDDHATVSIEQARKKLLEHHSQSWIRAIKHARASRSKNYMAGMAKLWANDEIWEDTLANERIIDYSDDPAVFCWQMKDVDLIISNPDMDDQQLRQYLHDIGKGMPLDTQFTILFPLHLDWKMGEWRVQLRDFPLPFIHFPEMSEQQKLDKEGNIHMTSVRAKGNFVIAEQHYDEESNIRHIKVPIVPYADMRPETEFAQSYIVDVCRTVNSIKMYTDLKFDIYTANPTRVTYANSMMPTLQTAMMQFDSFSKPPLDVSPKLGFWDKMRAIFHSRFVFEWHQGDVFLMLQASRSPFDLIGKAGGFVMGWRNQTRLAINEFDDPRRFFVVKSHDYVMAVPNYTAMAAEYLKSVKRMEYNMFTNWDFSQMLNYKKVVLKFSGNVEWVLGLMFERNKDGGRTSEFAHHNNIQLRLPAFVEDRRNYDAYREFRSDYIHMGISVSSTAGHSQTSYNTAHLSPQIIRYFMQWWSLFDGSLSLPLRSGKLFAPDMTIKPKFGRTLTTIQMQLELEPLFISHTYRHPHSEELTKNNKEACTGIKAKIDKFMMDLHQRREPGPKLDEVDSKKRWRMKMNLGEMNFKKTDLRVILAEFKEHSPEELLARKLGVGNSPASSISGDTSTNYGSGGADWNNAPSGRFSIPDNDVSWIDFDDYTEVDEPAPVHNIPKVAILPLIFTPQWTYYRQTDNSGQDEGLDEYGKEYQKFGNLLVHKCKIGHGNPERIQSSLLRDRISEVEEQLKTDEATVDSLQEDLKNFPGETKIREKADVIIKHIKSLKHRRKVLFCILHQNGLWTEEDERLHPIETNILLGQRETKHEDADEAESLLSVSSNVSLRELNELADLQGSTNEFCNRFIVHNVQLKWNNTIRNALFRYLHRVSYRRQAMYYGTRKAVKYVEELIKKRMATASNANNGSSAASERESLNLSRSDVESLADYMAGNVGNCPAATMDADESNGQNRMENFDNDLHKVNTEDHFPEDAYLVKFVSPQIQLVSHQNPDQCLLVTAHDIDMRMVNVIDKHLIGDDVSATVETRYGVRLNDAQFFVLGKSQVDRDSVVLFSTSNYGNERLSVWPPWLAVEVCFDSSPLQDDLVVPATNVALRFDKPNSMHMKKGNSNPNSRKSSVEESEERVGTGDDPDADFCSKAVRKEKYRSNRIMVDFPKVVVTSDSRQYFAIYTIAMDLLMYSEPTSKKQSDRIERVLLATDFRDLDKAVKRLVQLQADVARIHDLSKEISIAVATTHNEHATEDKLMLEVEYRQLMLELSVMFSAIKAGLMKGQRDETQFLKWAIGADQIIWHVLDEDRVPLLDLGLADASFNRLQHGDYNSNTVEVGMMQGFNLTPHSAYPEMLAPYLEDEKQGKSVLDHDVKMISIKWIMLGPIGGIPIMQLFETKLKPLKIQLERDTGEKIFEYLFPPKKDKEKKEQARHGDDNGSSTSRSVSSSKRRTHSDLLSIDTSRSETSSGKGPRLFAGFHHRKEADSQKLKEERIESPFVIPSIRRKDSDMSSTVVSDDDDDSSFDEDADDLQRTRTFGGDSASIASSLSLAGSESGSMTTNDSKPISRGTKKRKSRKRKTSRDKEGEDDLTTMVNRASSYMSVVKIMMNSTVVCVSYKGHGSRSFTDIHEFVIQLPNIEYTNKTWSSLDLALRVKKDVVKILFQHSGALIGNKISKHLQRSKRENAAPLRQISDYVQFTSLSDLAENGPKKVPAPLLTLTSANGKEEVISKAASELTAISGTNTAHLKIDSVTVSNTASSNSSISKTPASMAPSSSLKDRSSQGSLNSEILRKIPTVKPSELSHSVRQQPNGQSNGHNRNESSNDNWKNEIPTPTSPATKGISTGPENEVESSLDSPGDQGKGSPFSRLKHQASRKGDSPNESHDNGSTNSTPTKRAKGFFKKLKHLTD